MQDDGRNLTVAREHLNAALEEILRAQGQAEQSMAEASVGRALDQLNLVVRRLEQQRTLAGRGDQGRAVERAFAGATTAWQRTHDTRNAGAVTQGSFLEQIRLALGEAIDAVDEAVRLNGNREAA
jgi:hypothetical protein